MANEAENAIYNRLAAAPTFHPASAELFAADWTLEPGDVVTVKSGAEAYSVPVYSMNLDWKGTSKVTIESTGNERREPLPALKRQQYSGGAAAYNTQKELKRFTAEFTQYESDTDAKIGLVVSEVAGQNVVNAASIVAYINAAGSSVVISADHIDLDGYVTANELAAQIASFYNATTDTLSADWITAQGGQMGALTLSTLRVGGASDYYKAEWKQKTISGVTINYLGKD